MSDMADAIALLVGKSRCVPTDPEREGHHWVRRFKGGPAIPINWSPTWWHNADRGWGSYSQPDREDQWEYLGPCLAPNEIKQLRDEVAIWKDRYESERADHEATIKHCDDALNER